MLNSAYAISGLPVTASDRSKIRDRAARWDRVADPQAVPEEPSLGSQLRDVVRDVFRRRAGSTVESREDDFLQVADRILVEQGVPHHPVDSPKGVALAVDLVGDGTTVAERLATHAQLLGHQLAFSLPMLLRFAEGEISGRSDPSAKQVFGSGYALLGDLPLHLDWFALAEVTARDDLAQGNLPLHSGQMLRGEAEPVSLLDPITALLGIRYGLDHFLELRRDELPVPAGSNFSLPSDTLCFNLLHDAKAGRAQLEKTQWRIRQELWSLPRAVWPEFPELGDPRSQGVDWLARSPTYVLGFSGSAPAPGWEETRELNDRATARLRSLYESNQQVVTLLRELESGLGRLRYEPRQTEESPSRTASELKVMIDAELARISLEGEG